MKQDLLVVICKFKSQKSMKEGCSPITTKLQITKTVFPNYPWVKEETTKKLENILNEMIMKTQVSKFVGGNSCRG